MHSPKSKKTNLFHVLIIVLIPLLLIGGITFILRGYLFSKNLITEDSQNENPVESFFSNNFKIDYKNDKNLSAITDIKSTYTQESSKFEWIYLESEDNGIIGKLDKDLKFEKKFTLDSPATNFKIYDGTSLTYITNNSLFLDSNSKKNKLFTPENDEQILDYQFEANQKVFFVMTIDRQNYSRFYSIDNKIEINEIFKTQSFDSKARLLFSSQESLIIENNQKCYELGFYDKILTSIKCELIPLNPTKLTYSLESPTGKVTTNVIGQESKINNTIIQGEKLKNLSFDDNLFLSVSFIIPSNSSQITTSKLYISGIGESRKYISDVDVNDNLEQIFTIEDNYFLVASKEESFSIYKLEKTPVSFTNGKLWSKVQIDNKQDFDEVVLIKNLYTL